MKETLVMEKYDAMILDCDGVLWHGEESLPGVHKVLTELQQKQKKMIFVTNNSTKGKHKLLFEDCFIID